MNFKDAYATLKKIARGKYHSLSQKRTIFSDAGGGQVENSFGVYIDGYDWHYAKSWKRAFALLREEMIK